MKKRLFAFITLALMLIFLALPGTAFAAASGNMFLVDNAGVLSENDYDNLLTKLQQASARYGVDIAAMTTDGTEGKNIEAFADDYFLDNGYGTNASGDGILFVIDVRGREWHFSTHGDTIYSFTDAGIIAMGDEVRQYLSNNDWAGAIDHYCDIASGMIDYRNREGHAYLQDQDSSKQSAGKIGFKGLIGAIVGIIGSLGITKGMKSKLETVKSKATASDYFDPGELKLTGQNDTFLYVNVSRIPIRDDSNKGGGGFSTHISSGGSSFGGGGGKF